MSKYKNLLKLKKIGIKNSRAIEKVKNEIKSTISEK